MEGISINALDDLEGKRDPRNKMIARQWPFFYSLLWKKDELMLWCAGGISRRDCSNGK